MTGSATFRVYSGNRDSGGIWRRMAAHDRFERNAKPLVSVDLGWSDGCPRQDSNLRSRLRSPFPCTALTSANALARVLPGRVSGATRGTGPPGSLSGVVPVRV